MYSLHKLIITINVVHEVQNKYKHKRKATRKAKKQKSKKNMTVTTSLYAQMFYGRTDVIFTNSTVSIKVFKELSCDKVSIISLDC